MHAFLLVNLTRYSSKTLIVFFYSNAVVNVYILETSERTLTFSQISESTAEREVMYNLIDLHNLPSLAKHGAFCPPDANPAEFVLEAIGAGSSKRMGTEGDWGKIWAGSEELVAVKREIAQLKAEGLAKPPIDE